MDRVFMWKTMTFRAYLNIVAPNLKVYTYKDGEAIRNCFGIWYEVSESLALVRENQIVSYGNEAACDQLWEHILNWVTAGMPDMACFQVQAFLSEEDIFLKENQWLTKVRDSQFVWALEEGFSARYFFKKITE